MNLHEALYTTRAMRRLKPDPIPYEVQARILDAAIRAPHVGEGWRFLLIDDRQVMAQLADLYAQASEAMFAQHGVDPASLATMDTTYGRAARSALYLVRHFAELPLLLIGVTQSRAGSAIDAALWSAMLAARAEGVGSAWTDILRGFCPDEVGALLGIPDGWHLQSVIPMGYPLGRWGRAERTPVHEVAARNSWTGDLGFTVPEPLWPEQG